MYRRTANTLLHDFNSGYFFDDFCKGLDAVFYFVIPRKSTADTNAMIILPGSGALAPGNMEMPLSMAA